MDTLTDYVLWMQDFSFSQVPFREVDALILCNLAYYNFSSLFDGSKDTVYVRDAQKILDTGSVEVEIAIHDEKYTELLQAVVASRRFGDLRMTDYEEIKRSDPPVQYAVVTFRDDSGVAFIGYRGTDDSLAGWYEDFIASFSKTEAQEMAAEYAKRVIAKDPDLHWILGGHSKGGNLAVYAGTVMDPALFAHVERIYDLDGPGLSAEVMGDISLDAALAKTTCILPEFSIVGKLFDMKVPDTRIIKSNAIGVLQHAPISWSVDHGKIAAVNSNHPISLWFNEFFSNWIACSDIEERRIFFDEMFEAISGGGSTTISELLGEGLEGIRRIQSRLKNPSEVTRRVLHEFTKQAFFASILPTQDKKEEEEKGKRKRGKKEEEKEPEKKDKKLLQKKDKKALQKKDKKARKK